MLDDNFDSGIRNDDGVIVTPVTYSLWFSTEYVVTNLPFEA